MRVITRSEDLFCLQIGAEGAISALEASGRPPSSASITLSVKRLKGSPGPYMRVYKTRFELSC